MLRKLLSVPSLLSQYVRSSEQNFRVKGVLKKSNFYGEEVVLCGVQPFHFRRSLITRPSESFETEEDTTYNTPVVSAHSPPFRRGGVPLYIKDLPTRTFNGIMFKELPIVYIKVTNNNTIITLSDFKGLTKYSRTAGAEGFKNAKKGTNVAAQATGLTFARKILELGYKTVRVKIQGIGAGRSSSIKGLTLGGLDIVSITDYTPVSDRPHRGKKLRRI